ncbi:hypothetical protein EIP86_001131 [Pleurotus ostreatoroseus]|nr:hypothetical protein EIP86_001131 [Pleurotus ostreatoroseus]
MALRSGLAARDTQWDDKILECELWDGITTTNPVGVAAGFDKHGEAIDGLFNLGFNWVEIGSVTPKPQPGNPKPRMFRLTSDGAVINRYGFPSEGHAVVLSRLKDRVPWFFKEEENVSASFKQGKLLVVNLGKNKTSPPDSIADFVTGVQTFAPYADVLVVNVSSPNTPGLRGMQTRSLLQELLSGVVKARDEVSVNRKPKLVLKIAPDLTADEIADIAAAVRTTGVDGVIVSNTTIKRPSNLTDRAYSLLSQSNDRHLTRHSAVNQYEVGGLSGTPLKPYSLAAVKALRPLLPASIPIFGCGGISTGEDALEYARAGATAVQLYTSFGFEGVGTCRRIKDEITDTLKKEGTTWAEVVRKAVQEKSLKEVEPVRPGEGSVAQLIAEAEELKALVDRLGESLA